MTASAGLELSDIHHAYDATPVVRDFSLEVAPGELVCLLGPSGCGKTTVLRLIAGLEPLQRGRIIIAGRVVGEPGRDLPPEARGVGFVFQDVALFPHLDIAGNVGYGLRRLSTTDRRARIEAMLCRVHLEGFATAWPHQLSGGQQQRVALARALAPAPRAILLDEPFSGLDTRLRSAVRDEALHLLKSDRVTTLVVTHDPEEAMFMADRIAVMREGRLEQIGAPAEVYTRPASEFVAEFMGDVNRIDGVVRAGVVETPFGRVPVRGHAEGAAVHVLIRPEALKVAGAEQGIVTSPPIGAIPARVLASRLLGRTSWVHVCLSTDPTHRHDLADGAEAHSHWHVRVPGQFLPGEGSELRVSLDPRQAFVFAVPSPT
jgi:iron(III) transport system ATP-binding protein